MSTSLQLVEPIIDAAVSKLRAGFGQRVAAINADYADDYILSEPLANDIYPFGIPGGQLTRTPAVVVTWGGSGDEGFASEEGAHGLMLSIRLLVMVVEQQTDIQALGRRMLRLQTAVTETLWDDDPAERLRVVARGKTTLPYLTVSDALPGPIGTPQESPAMFRQHLILLFDVLNVEA